MQASGIARACYNPTQMLRQKLISHRRDDGFRWRGAEVSRIEGLSDAVFAFAVTLLIVSLEVPKTFDELMAVIRGFFGFAICFALLLQVWHEQYRFFRRYNLEDSTSLVLNCILLFLVLFYVYPLKFLFSLLFSPLTGAEMHGQFKWHEASLLMRIYAAGFAAVFGLFVLMYIHAYRLRRELDLNPVEVFSTRIAMQENAILAMIGLTSVCIAMKSPEWAGWIYCLIGPLLGVHGAIYGRRLRLLAEPAENSRRVK